MKIKSLIAGGLAASLSMPALSSNDDFSGFMRVSIGHEDIGQNSQFAPQQQFVIRGTQNHDDMPWQSTSFGFSADGVNVRKGETMFEAGTGIRPREFRVTLNGIGEGDCTSVRLGSHEPTSFDNGSILWEPAFFKFSPAVAAEEVASVLGLVGNRLTGVGVTHTADCSNGGNAEFQGDIFYRSPSNLRQVWGQHDNPAEGLPGDNNTPSWRAAFKNRAELSDDTNIQYGLNALYLREGENHGVRVSEAQSSYIGHVLLNHTTDNNIGLRGIFEAGYIENAKGHPDRTGEYLNAYGQALAPVHQSVSLTFSAFAAQNPSELGFFGKQVAGTEAGFEWTVHQDDRSLIGFTAKKGAYHVEGGGNEGWHDTDQIIMNARYEF